MFGGYWLGSLQRWHSFHSSYFVSYGKENITSRLLTFFTHTFLRPTCFTHPPKKLPFTALHITPANQLQGCCFLFHSPATFNLVDALKEAKYDSFFYIKAFQICLSQHIPLVSFFLFSHLTVFSYTGRDTAISWKYLDPSFTLSFYLSTHVFVPLLSHCLGRDTVECLKIPTLLMFLMFTCLLLHTSSFHLFH